MVPTHRWYMKTSFGATRLVHVVSVGVLNATQKYQHFCQSSLVALGNEIFSRPLVVGIDKNALGVGNDNGIKGRIHNKAWGKRRLRHGPRVQLVAPNKRFGTVVVVVVVALLGAMFFSMVFPV